jgi:hypothetical protein
MTALENAIRLAATVGVKQFWTIQQDAGVSYIVSDPVAQLAAARSRYMVTDDDAIDLARKAGVTCEDDGRIA